jgi:hypothetical protein
MEVTEGEQDELRQELEAIKYSRREPAEEPETPPEASAYRRRRRGSGDLRGHTRAAGGAQGMVQEVIRVVAAR